jgi:hypothetical protein
MRVNRMIICMRLTAGLLIVLCLALIGSNAPVAQVTEKVDLSVTDARPVAKALEELERRYGWVITYEDPVYDSTEAIDVTAQVRKDGGRNGEPRVLIPKGGPLSITYEVDPNTKLPLDRDAVVQKVLDANQPAGSVARFRLEREKDGHMLHVIPTVNKTSAGELVPHTSVLDAVISLSQGDRTRLQTMDALCDAISQATQTKVEVGSAPLNLFMAQRDQEGVFNQKARDVLVQMLKRTRSRANLSWRLLYGPDMKMYMLNVYPVALRAADSRR